MAYTVKQVQSTPNPNAMKFVLDRAVVMERLSFTDPSAATDHALANSLFAIGGVSSLLLLGDFITIGKTTSAKWASITPKVKRVLQSHEVSND